MAAREIHSSLAPRPSTLIRVILLAALLPLLQGCGLLERMFKPEEYKPIMAPQPAATPVAAVPMPAPQPPPTLPTEAERPGNPESWGDAGKMGVGREFDSIYFNGQSTELDQVAKGRLNGYIEWLKGRPQVWITLAGHADRHNPMEYAYNLGMARALAVAEYLAGGGLEPGRVYTITYGKDRPASDGTEPADDALNSRVEVLGFVAPLGQEAPAPAPSMEKEAAPEAEMPVPSALGRDLSR